jgi:hypothetical protein
MHRRVVCSYAQHDYDQRGDWPYSCLVYSVDRYMLLIMTRILKRKHVTVRFSSRFSHESARRLAEV